MKTITRKAAGFLLVVLFLCSGCWFVDMLIGSKESAPEGKGGALGVTKETAEAADKLGVPYGKLIGAGSGMLASIIAFFAGRRGKIDGAGTVNLIGELKDGAIAVKNEEDFNKLIRAFARKFPEYGAALAKLHKKTRGL